MEEEKIYFNFSASFRIADVPELHDEIILKTGIEPSHCHKKGELRFPNSNSKKKWENDAWIIKSPLNEEEPLTNHLKWLWEQIKPHKEYFKELIAKNVKIDIFCGYRSNCDHAGFELMPEAFEIVNELKIPIGFSVIIA